MSAQVLIANFADDHELFFIPHELSIASGPYPKGVQPAALGPQAAQDGYECSPAQNLKFT